ncbi:MAG: DEAD/DEAH box helicase [Anaerolineaceae bacterium]
MDIDSLLETWKTNSEFRDNIALWQIKEPTAGMLGDFPESMSPALQTRLRDSGINQLYLHQILAWRHLEEGLNVVLSTGTASGKTLAYNLPVLNKLIQSGQSTALYLFPTKALAQDQLRTLQSLSTSSIKPAIYDGDTPTGHRSDIRKTASIVITNPDMLHQGILPHHTLWQRFFSGLRFVVLDEMHTYRGVFGSHVANVIRRLKRIAAFYGAFPQFILTSATIGNPLELAEHLTEQPVELVEQDGSPHGKRHFILYNPPLIDPQLGLRKSAIQTGVRVANELLEKGHQTLVFSRTRRTVEMLLTYLLEKTNPMNRGMIRGYRSGYLKSERREIEQGFKSNQIKTVVSTSALELGIDIGDLESVLIIGYPGSIANTLQRAGRAGRKQQPSLALLIASPDAMDQYLATHPEYLTGSSPENALIDANNLSILLQHLRCAAFELPFKADEAYGLVPISLIQAYLEMLAQTGELNKQNDKYFWVADQFPSGTVSLRSSTPNVITLNEMTDMGSRLVGQIDAGSANWLVHPEAIYLHEAESYEVLSLDLEAGKCELKRSDKDYYTLPDEKTTIEEFSIIKQQDLRQCGKRFGNLSLLLQVVGYRKIRWFTNETVGHGEVDLPPHSLNTTGFWLTFSPELIELLRETDQWNADPNHYGTNWPKLREKILLRDSYTCRGCGARPEPGTLHVHHIQPFRSFLDKTLADSPSNLVTLCPSCHRQAEIAVRIRSGLAGASYALRNLAPLLIMCDREDIQVLSEIRSVLDNNRPVILVYDNIPGGLGLSERLYELHEDWVHKAIEMIDDCQCLDGCPACVGPIGEEGYGGKVEALSLLKGLF